MESLISKFSKIWIDERSSESLLASRIRKLFPAESIQCIAEMQDVAQRGRMSAEEFNQSKKQILVTPFEGQFFKRCPGSRPGLMCCNYFVLNLGLQCDFNCSYCYLQSFLNSRTLTIYSNIDRAIRELRQMHTELGGQGVRIGTGEVIDSLSLDPITLYSRTLIEAFTEFPNWKLEFKTKSNHVDQFLDIPSPGNVIVSWSINPEYIVSSEEHGTASLKDRLEAAKKCLQKDYQVAFHIDPMIWHPDWKASYSEMVDQITSHFSPMDVPYFSVGGLRFQPEQRHLMRQRFPASSWVNRAETFVSSDGKWRYDAQVRSEMFQFVIERFRSHNSQWRIFLCMETPETWMSTLGQSPFKQNEMNDLFDPKVLAEQKRWALNHLN